MSIKSVHETILFFTDSHSQFLYLIGWWYFCCQKSSHQFHWVICMSNKIAELPSSAVNISLCFQIIISFREVCISHFQISSWQCDLLAISIELSNCFWRTQNIPTPGKVRLLFLKRSFFLGFLCLVKNFTFFLVKEISKYTFHRNHVHVFVVFQTLQRALNNWPMNTSEFLAKVEHFQF